MKRCLYAVEADTSRWANWVKQVSDKMSEQQILSLKERFELEAGEGFVVLDSKFRPEFLPVPTQGDQQANEDSGEYLVEGAARSVTSIFRWSSRIVPEILPLENEKEYPS